MAKKAVAKTATNDGLRNLMTGMGTEADKFTQTAFAAGIEIDQGTLDVIYRNDWVGRKVVDLPAFDATREWRSWQTDENNITKLEEAENAFNLQRKTQQALIKARLYGGSALVLGVENGAPNEELVVDSVKTGQLKFVHVVSRHDINAGPIEQDIMSPYFGQPKWYDRMVERSVRLHPSRVVQFIGSERQDNLKNGWGDPVLQVVQDAIKAAGTVTNGVASLVDESKIDVIKIPDLTASISDPEYEARLKRRFGFANVAKGIYKMLLLDKEEEWQRIEANFTALPDILKMYLLIACGAADIPATRMLGQSPAGLSATGESDLRNYYDRVAVEQKTVIKPAMSKLDEVMIRSVLGSKPEGIFYEWNSLWQMDEATKAEIDKKKAEIFKIDVDSGVMDPQVMRQARTDQLIEDGVYPGLKETVAEFESDMEDLSPEARAEREATANAAKVANAEANLGAEEANAGAAGDPAVPPKKAGTRKSQKDLPLDALTTRIRTHDARPRTLYVYRSVLNFAEIAKWAKANGFKKTVGKEMHVTVAHSAVPLDWSKVSEDWGNGGDKDGKLTLAPGGMRMIDKLGDARALLFTSSALSWRHCQIKEAGAKWDYPDYQPHITISYDENVDVTKLLSAYQGEIVFGPETWEEIKTDGNYRETLVEDAKWTAKNS